MTQQQGEMINMDFKTFVDENKITIKNKYADRNPNMQDSKNMNNYKSTLTIGKKTIYSLF